MKKFVILFVFVLLLICIFVDYNQKSYFKVLKIISPKEIVLDFNRNFILDEKEVFTLKNIYDISDFDEQVSPEKKFIFRYYADLFSSNILKNSFVAIKDGDLLINGKSYKKLLVESGFFFDDTDSYKQNFKQTLNGFNPDDYIILNKKSKKYHKLYCENGKKALNYVILNKNKLDSDVVPAKCCNDVQNQYKPIRQSIENNISIGSVDVYFIDLNSVFSPKYDCEVMACKVLKSEIDNSKKTIDFAVYGFNNQPEIFDALRRAKLRGVKIRWVSNYDNVNYYPEIEKLKQLLPLYKNNVSSNYKTSFGLMHNKFFIFDDKKVFTGSANVTSTDLSGFNANYSLLISSDQAAKIYKDEFEQMYNGSFAKNKKVLNNINTIFLNNDLQITILFSPQNLIVDNYLINLINNSKKYIYIPIFFITDRNIQTALINAQKRGVDVMIINDATNAKSRYTVHHVLRKNNIKVKTENYAGKMHMKSMVIDDKYSIIGSMNFTSSGNKRNDENVVIIENQKIAKYLKENFLYLWEKIPDKYLYYDPKAESFESVGSCFDGIDNDFDNKIDDKDEGCIIKQ